VKLKNTTDWPDWFLRRMIRWCAKHVELPPKALRSAQFRRRTTCSYSGCGGSGRITVSIGPASKFPVEEHKVDGYPGMCPRIADPTEALVAITAHELTHVREMAKRVSRMLSERQTMYEERRLLRMFQEDRERLLAEWSEPPAERPAKPKASVQEKRAAKAQAALANWQRKLRLAQTKVKQYKKRVRYYETVAARKGG
jgi:hypothetical protein